MTTDQRQRRRRAARAIRELRRLYKDAIDRGDRELEEALRPLERVALGVDLGVPPEE